MKVLLVEDIQSKSGVGVAIKHQKKALLSNNIEVTSDLKCKDYDVIHLNLILPKSYFMAKKAKKQGKKVVFHGHSTKEDFQNSFVGSNMIAPLFKQWIKMCYNAGDIILTPTPYSKSILDTYKLKREIYSISNGIDTKWFTKNKKEGKKFREKYGYTKDDKIIIGIGHLIYRKGIDDFINLAKQLPEYKFIWFGNLNFPLITSQIKKLIADKSDNLKFVSFVPREEIIHALSGSDLFLFPSREETEGIVMLEALSTEIQVLCRDIPVYDKWLEHGKSVYKAQNFEDFKNLIKQILEKKLTNTIKEGHKVAKERDLEKIGAQLVSYYEKIDK
ncbi:MAG: glycosyltransferase [Bacilli bacterium]